MFNIAFALSVPQISIVSAIMSIALTFLLAVKLVSGESMARALGSSGPGQAFELAARAIISRDSWRRCKLTALQIFHVGTIASQFSGFAVLAHSWSLLGSLMVSLAVFAPVLWIYFNADSLRLRERVYTIDVGLLTDDRLGQEEQGSYSDRWSEDFGPDDDSWASG